MDWTIKKSWFSSLPNLRRRSFLKIGVGACASLIYGCGSRKPGSSPSALLKGEREWVSSVCTLCPSACAIRAYSEAGRIVAVGGDPDDPNTGGKMCPIGLSMMNLHANPDRLMRAFRKNPDGIMAPAPAEEIFERIAGRIRQGGSLHIYGRITPYTSHVSKILNAACHRDPLSEGISAYPSFLNTDGRPPILDFDNARIALLFDSNILEHGYPYIGYVRKISEARVRGLRLITLSPFLTNTATAGDWIPLRSSAAASLAALAVAQHALNDPDLHITPPPPEITDSLRSLDKAFLEKATGLSRETMQELTRRFFSEPGPAASDFPDPSILLLNIMKGNLNHAGGLLHPGPRTLRVEANSDDIAPILRDRRNVVLLHQANPAFSLSSEIRPILQSSDRATVVCVDSFMSETAELSDFVLPLASPLETLTLAEPLPLAKHFLAAALPAVKPPSACRSFDDWLVRLATALNGVVPALTPERFAAEMVSGSSSGKLATNRAVYPMPSDPKLLEAHRPFFMSSLSTLIASGSRMPALQAPLKPEQYFLTVFEESIQGPVTAPSKWLDEISYSPKIYLHPQRAGHLGIRSGDTVTLTGGNSTAAEGIALLFEGVHPDALAIPQHHEHAGCGRVARGEPFIDPVDPDMSRIFWGKNRGVNSAGIDHAIVSIQKKRG
jgi:thiosulfate reductase / polysulfide reductase chain A